jgi:hypothetical protein
MLSADDKRQLAEKGISEQQIQTQLEQLRTGFPFLRLRSAAAIRKGMLAPYAAECQTDDETFNA